MADLLNTVDTIGDAALADKLINRTITELNDNISSVIGDTAFEGCSNLVSVALPNVISINYMSFKDCTSLKVADFRKLTSVGQESFNCCTALEALIIRNYDAVPTISFSLGSSSSLGTSCYIYVPSALVNSYKSASIWSDYSDYIRAIEDYPEVCSYLGRAYEEVNDKISGSSSNLVLDGFYAADNLFLGYSYGSVYYLEDDGVTWTKTTNAGSSFRMSEKISYLKYHNGLYVYCTNQYNNEYSRLAYSEDGKTWYDSNIVNDISGNHFYMIDCSDDIWVAVGKKGAYYSEDGKTWTKSDNDMSNIERVVYGNGIFVAIGVSRNNSTGRGVYYSEDGKVWTKVSNISSSYNLMGLAYANDTFVVTTGNSNENFYTSTDGKTWNGVKFSSLATGAGTTMGSVWYVNNKLFVYCTGKIYCSDDLTTFVCDENKYRELMHMCFANHVYIAAVGRNGDIYQSSTGYKHGLLYSYDGITWHQSSVNSAYYNYSDMYQISCYCEANQTLYTKLTNAYRRSKLWD